MKTITQNTNIYYRIACYDELILKAKNLCHDVYLNMGYIEKTYPDRIIPNELEHASSYIVATNDDNEVIGTLRLTAGPPFTTLKIWENKIYKEFDSIVKEIQQGKTFELGALAVRKEYSSMKVSHGLYNAAYQCAISLEMDYGIISMDTRAFRCLEMAGWKAIRIGEPIFYFGSMTIPAIIPTVIQKNQRIENNLNNDLRIAI